MANRQTMDWELVRTMYRANMSIRAIARELGFRPMSVAYAIQRMRDGHQKADSKRGGRALSLMWDEIDPDIQAGMLNNAQIGRKHGVSASSISNRRLNVLKLTNNPSPNSHLGPIEERIEKAREMFADGASQREVFRTLHLGHETMDRHFPDAPKWSPQQVSQLGVAVRLTNQQIRKMYPNVDSYTGL